MTIYLHVKIKQLPSEAKIHSERVENILLKTAYPKIWVSTTFFVLYKSTDKQHNRFMQKAEQNWATMTRSNGDADELMY